MKDPKTLQEQALRLHKIFRAWNLHMTSRYDAWENNFGLSQKMPSFLRNVRINGTDENHAMRAVMQLETAGIPPEQYRDLIVVGFDIPGRNLSVQMPRAINAYKLWKNRHGKPETGPEDFYLDSFTGLPLIMARVQAEKWSGLMVAEALSNSNSWAELWKYRSYENFLFDMVWAKIHKYKPLFTEN